MRKWKVLGPVLVSGFTAPALAQQVTVPTAYMWAPAIPSAWPTGMSGLTPMVHIDTNYPLPDGTGNPITSPTAAGIFAAHRAADLATASGSSATFKVCILIKDFGVGGDQNPSLTLNQRNFFDPADDLQPVAGNFNWPHPTVLDANNNPQPDPTAKPYLHPFLVNANSGPANITRRPLRDWMQQFVTGYLTVTGAPKPNAFYFDNEVVVASPVGQNPIYLLEQISHMPYYWSQIPVPGQVHPVTGLPVTLQELYSIQVGDHGWMTDIGDQITSAASAVDHAGNREVMSWWYGISQQARDAVLKYSAYDVIHAAPNWSDVKCGNYDDLSADGGMDTTGWFIDRGHHNTGGVVDENSDPRPADRTWNYLPRSDADRGWGAPLYFLTAPANATPLQERRWWGLAKKASGEVDSGVLYELTAGALNGFGLRPGFRQTNPYNDVTESDWHSALRIARHCVESSINSNGGMHSNRLAPWVQMPYTQFVGTFEQTDTNYRKVSEIAAMIAMLRAKNSPEIQFFTDNARAPYTDHTVQSWPQTAQMLRQVYATRVLTYKDAYASLPFPGSPPPPPADPSLLEFTLRDANGNDRTANISSVLGVAHMTPQGVVVTEYMQELQVDFSWPTSGWPGLLEVVPPITSGKKLRINVEYSTDRADAIGSVYLWSPPHLNPQGTLEPGQWSLAKVTATALNEFACKPAAYSGGRWHNRVSLEISAEGVIWSDPYDQVWKSRLRIHQTSPTPAAWTSRFDLVQLYPEYATTAPAVQGFSVGDVNLDGVVDEIDFIQFLGDWTNDAPPADLDMNDSVDFDDFVTFLDALG